MPTGELVPWLAASGPLSYTPEASPDRDYFFQYSWVLPGIFASHVNTLQHLYFGARWKTEARELFAFWHAAREGRVDRIAHHDGRVAPDSVTAPIAVYLARSRLGEARYLLMQHGSYQLVRVADQPLLESGELLLYRGVQEAELFRWPNIGADRSDDGRRHAWRAYVKTQAHVLSDSVRSFNSIHDRAKRCETSHLRDGTWMTDDVAREHGLDIDHDGFAGGLWAATHESFSLERWVAERKFGPNFVVLKTPLDTSGWRRSSRASTRCGSSIPIGSKSWRCMGVGTRWRVSRGRLARLGWVEQMTKAFEGLDARYRREPMIGIPAQVS